jgi:hypothetical protein
MAYKSVFARASVIAALKSALPKQSRISVHISRGNSGTGGAESTVANMIVFKATLSILPGDMMVRGSQK